MFNVINDAWIKTDKGKFGIRELLKNASDISEIIGENPINEYATYRFLFVFLMDALQVSEAGKKNLLDKGAFDMDVIDAYIEKCEKEGVSFDIFDKNHPFIQEWGSFEDAEIKTIGKLNILKPTGTNKRFFDKDYEDSIEMTDDEIARYLVTPTLHMSEGQGYATCISGCPMYVIAKGNNLFETLMFGVIPTNKAESGYGLPAWRMGSFKGKATKEYPISEQGLLLRLTMPIRRMRIIDNRSMYYEGGFYFLADSWKDPYVPYFKDKDGKYISMKAKENFHKQWEDLLTLCKSSTNNLKAIETCKSYLKMHEQPLKLLIYEGLKSKSRYTDMHKGDYFNLPPNKINNAEEIDRLRALASYGDSAASYLNKALYVVFKDTTPGIKPYAMQIFYRQFDEMFQKQMLESGPVDYEKWINSICHIALKTFDDVTLSRLKTDALINSMNAKGLLINRIMKLKERKEEN